MTPGRGQEGEDAKGRERTKGGMVGWGRWRSIKCCFIKISSFHSKELTLIFMPLTFTTFTPTAFCVFLLTYTSLPLTYIFLRFPTNCSLWTPPNFATQGPPSELKQCSDRVWNLLFFPHQNAIRFRALSNIINRWPKYYSRITYTVLSVVSTLSDEERL